MWFCLFLPFYYYWYVTVQFLCYIDSFLMVFYVLVSLKTCTVNLFCLLKMDVDYIAQSFRKLPCFDVVGYSIEIFLFYSNFNFRGICNIAILWFELFVIFAICQAIFTIRWVCYDCYTRFLHVDISYRVLFYLLISTIDSVWLQGLLPDASYKQCSSRSSSTSFNNIRVLSFCT